MHGPVSGASSCGSRLYPKALLPIKKAVKTSGALGGVNCAEASTAVTTASSSARLKSETAEKVCGAVVTGAHLLPSVYLMLSARLLPLASRKPATLTSTAKLLQVAHHEVSEGARQTAEERKAAGVAAAAAAAARYRQVTALLCVTHKSRTAEPFLGGTKLAAMVSTFLASLGGQVSLITTTNGPGVSGIAVVSSVAPVPESLIVIVPLPLCPRKPYQSTKSRHALRRCHNRSDTHPWKIDTQSLNWEKR